MRKSWREAPRETFRNGNQEATTPSHSGRVESPGARDARGASPAAEHDAQLPDAAFPDPGTQDLGYDNAAVGLLIILEDGDDGAGDGDGSAVQRVRELRPLGVGGLETNRQPA